jgi:hypothetical protein
MKDTGKTSIYTFQLCSRQLCNLSGGMVRPLLWRLTAAV